MGDGPDRIIPCDNYTTWDQDGAVHIRKTSDWPANMEPVSLVTMFDKTCQSAGAGLTVYKYKEDGKYVSVSYADYHKLVKTVARAFIKLGLEPNRAVAIWGFNSPEWFQADIACTYVGGMVSHLPGPRLQI